MAAQRPYERVYTMTDYYDGPRRGIADFDGRPHLYTSHFEDMLDGYSDSFELQPIDDATLQLALESWAIWLRWDDAFHAGEVTLDTHPALPADRARHDELDPVLEATFAALPRGVVYATASFRPSEGHTDGGRGRHMQVQWQPSPPPAER